MQISVKANPKPFVKWVGGKRQIIKKLHSRLPREYNHYYEPFIGGGALLFSLLPDIATINDLNDELINAYNAIKNHAKELIQNLRQHNNNEEYFYNIRAIQPSSLNNIERASRFIYLNKTCFNGLWRVNRKGEFNAPFGRYKNPNILDKNNILTVSEYLNKAKVDIMCGDFAKAVANAKKGDFIYFDPPYQPISTTANFTSYNKRGFDEYEQVRLAETFRLLDSRGCFVMLSNSNSKFILNLYKEYNTDKITAKRAVNCNGNGRTGAKEIIVRNYEEG